MSISLDWLSADFPTEESAKKRVANAVAHTFQVLRKHFGDVAVGSDDELVAVRADWWLVFAKLSPEACRHALAEAIVLADCPSLFDFERLAQAHWVVAAEAVAVEVVADAAPVAAELPRVISDGVNVSNQVPADKLKGANAWAWHLRSLTAARSLIREVERNGQMFVHRAALEFHLTRSQKLVRKSDGRLAVNERLFAP